MLKRAKRIWTKEGSTVEKLIHECQVEAHQLSLRTWYCQREGVNRPGDGKSGENLFGEDLDPRLAGLLFSAAGEVTVAWDPVTLKEGAVCYVSTLFDGKPAPTAYRMLEVDDLAENCGTSIRQEAQYPHWHHKEHVYVHGFLQHIQDTTGIGLYPALKITANEGPATGFNGDGIIIEAGMGPLGFIGEFDHMKPGNPVEFRDYRKLLPDGKANPNFSRFSTPPEKPSNWEFG